MQNLDGKSMNIIEQNIEKLKEIFPEVFSEGKIDFSKLEEELGFFKEKSDERYNFTWNGKSEAKKIALTPSTGTLRPCKEESKDWDKTQNLYIEGDNLEVLKLLQKSYHKKVKMIYIDPPYNTGKDFVYKDNFRDNIKNYLEITGQVDSDGNKLSTNSETSGRYHSDWLNMMYPRLKLARNLLKDDGVIFISIANQEIDNLIKVCNEIFGEDNFIGNLIWRKKEGGGMADDYFSTEHEYILVFQKSKNFQWNDELVEADEKDFNKEDERGKYSLVKLAKWGNTARKEDRPSMYFSIVDPDGKNNFPIAPDGSDGRWRVGKDKINYLIENSLIEFIKREEKWIPYEKIYFDPSKGKSIKLRSILYDIGGTAKGTNQLTELFIKKDIFENPKPIELFSSFGKFNTKDNDIILDFFSGSATTAHAVMKLNSEDDGSRKFICVQLPELTSEKSEAYKAGYKNICEIGKERIRRAGEKVKSESGKTELDIGFKVLKLDSSNIKSWDSDFENLETNLLDSVENIKSDRNEEDLLYEILLKYGLDLTLPIEELNINGKKIFSIGFGSLVCCLDNDIDTNIVEKIAELKKQFETDFGLENMRVVFKDSSFKDSVVKTNALQILKQNGINEVVSV
ncbi:site-specific DNA-methyltransferase [Aliarcobacter cryaerophilus]|uniref:site-specific DNA-methyltransferase n=1 Tax=Aliarcobacter cryaerophilus TaxID=28198 RepID=UPI003DA3A5F7